jgi:uncharacterized protein YyaL (SSP411 family)
MRTTQPNDREQPGSENRARQSVLENGEHIRLLSEPHENNGSRSERPSRPGPAVRAVGDRWSLVATLSMTIAAAMLILLGCSLPEGDADSTPPEGPGKGGTNRLSRETSPYLLAHARNPVDWYPWGPEALEKARKEEKPIFLSIGYSSCHWCHVMEQKVFSDPEIARYMNEHFINIKVDREERPDIDEVYMTALHMYFQAIKSTQTGGWPLSIFLTPDGRPLGGGTYFPPKDEEGRTGFPTLMKTVAEMWRDRRRQMETNADILADAVRQASRPDAARAAPKLEHALLEPVLKSLEASYDAEFGGFGFNRNNPDRPKFPVPVKLALLQYEAKRRNDERAGKMLHDTLDRMAAGGIHDHVGGGFHRYSTDRFWRVPHFEKMLYDNAQLADVYAEAYRHTGQEHYRAIAEDTIAFVFRELTDPRGAFYSSLDADSEGVEGKYYVWTAEELAATLSADELAICKAVYGTEGSPRFELGYVLEQVLPIDAAATTLKRPAVQLERELKTIHEKLLAARQKRTAPARDDKILTSWNGLMIHTLARAGVIFEKPEYVQAGAKAAEFLLSEMRDEKGRLFRSYRVGQARVGAYLDDYAFLVEGLLALHLATGDEKWGNAARRLADQQMQLFWDDAGKGCYFTANDHETLLARTKNGYDSVLPSGNSVTVRNLLRLASISKQTEYRDRARQCLDLFVPLMEDSPAGMTNLALALSEYLDTAESDTPRRDSRRARIGIAPDAEVLLAGGQKSAPQSAGKGQKKPEVVTANAFLSVDRLPPGGTCKLLVQLAIAEGWHIHANPAGDPEFDLATELSVKSALGTELTKIRFPAGQKVSRGPGEKPLLQYAGRANLLGLLEVPADIAGRKDELTIEVTFQACNDVQCHPPKTITLKLPVAVANKGEAVKSINDRLFATPKK